MRWRWAVLVAGILSIPAWVSAQVPQSATSMLNTYCVGCHNERLQSGGMMLDRINTANVRVDADVWERILRRLRSRTMPPPGRMPRPTAADYDSAIAGLSA